MTSPIGQIIERHRAKLRDAGFLRAAAPASLSPRLAAIRPSLTMALRALAERREFIAIKQTPLALLFEYTLPRIEPILIELGETRANEIVQLLCDHGQKMIAQHGLEKARQHLEGLFKDLPEHEKIVREANGMERMVEAYRAADLEGREDVYLLLMLNDRIEELEVADSGLIGLTLRKTATDADLVCLKKARKLQQLDLKWCATITDAGLAHLSALTNLQKLSLRWRNITDAGLAHLKTLNQLQELDCNLCRQITDAGLAHLISLKYLRRLDISQCYQITDAGLAQLQALTNLEYLDLNACEKITDAGLGHLGALAALQKLQLGMCGGTSYEGVVNLIKMIPGLEVYKW